jgi:pimeloyl-ACP methyl ester carboxylesterase
MIHSNNDCTGKLHLHSSKNSQHKRHFLKVLVTLLFVLGFSGVAAAGYTLSPSIGYSDQVVINSGTPTANSGSIKATASISGSNINFVISNASGGAINGTITGGVYKNSYTTANKIASASAPSGSVGVTVTIPIAEGDYKVLLGAVDGSNTYLFYFNSTTFHVAAVPPSINPVNASPNPVTVGNLVTISATLSGSLPSGYSLRATLQDGSTWLSPNPMTGSGTSYSYTRSNGFSVAGLRNYKVEMLNSSNSVVATQAGTVQVNAPVTNTAPVLSTVTAPSASVTVNNAVTMTLRATDTENNLQNIQVNWGDGSILDTTNAISGNNVTFTHTYTSIGSRSWGAMAYDGAGATSNALSGNITVNSVVVVPSISPVNASPNPVTVGNLVTISATLSGSLPSGYSLRATLQDGSTWLSPNPMTGSGTSYSYSRSNGFSVAGLRNYKVEMLNSSNVVVATQPGTVQVNEPTPNITISASPTSPLVGQPVTFTATTDITATKVEFQFSGEAKHSMTASNSGKTWTYPRPEGLADTATKTYYLYVNGSTTAAKTGTITAHANTKPVISAPSVGATAAKIAGSFTIADPDGEKVKNMRLRLKDSSGQTCSTGYFSAGFDQPVTPGNINFTTGDCISVLNWNNSVTYWIEAWDVSNNRADEVTGTVTVANNTLLPTGATIRWDSAPETIIVNTTYTLQLSVVDASGNVVTGFSGVGGLLVTGLAIETDNNQSNEYGRYVWFDKGVARITGFKSTTPGQGTMRVVLAQSSATTNKLTQAEKTTPTPKASSVDSTGSDYKNVTCYLSTAPFKPFSVRLRITGNKEITSNLTVEYRYRKNDTDPWSAWSAKQNQTRGIDPTTGEIAFYVIINPIEAGTKYQFRITEPGYTPGITTEKGLSWIDPTNNERVQDQNISYNLKKGRPILLVPGIMGSTRNKSDLIPNMPATLCTSLDVEHPGCNSLEMFYPPVAKLPDTLGWINLKKQLESMGYTVYEVPWDWRLSLDDAVENYLQPKIDKALTETGYSKVDIIAHSMGGLVTRRLIQDSGTTQIERFIMLGTPNGGSVNAYFLLAAADPIGLDRDFANNSWMAGLANLDYFYTKTADNLFQNSRNRTPLVYECDTGEGCDSTKYSYYDDNENNRRNALQELAPGGMVLFPQSKFLTYNFNLVQHKLQDDYSKQLTEINDGSTVKKGQLLCYAKENDRKIKTENDVYTWLYLSSAHSTILNAATDKNLVNGDINEFSAKKGVKLQFATDKAGDGTVPSGGSPGYWARMGMSSLEGGCIDTVKATFEHAKLPADQGARNAIYAQLRRDRTDLSPAVLKMGEKAEVANTNFLTVRVGEPLPVTLATGGIQFGSTAGGGFLAPPDNARYETSSISTSLSIEAFAAGEQTFTVYSPAPFVNQLIRIEIASTVGSAIKQEIDKRLLVTDTNPLVLKFNVADDGAISLTNRPDAPRKVEATFDSTLTNTILHWSVPSTGTPAKYRIYRREVGRHVFALLGEVAGTITSYTANIPALPFGSITPGNEFVIVAVNSAGLTGFISKTVSNITDTTPEQITFTPLQGAAGTWATSETITVTGINVPTTVTITGGQYSINGGAFTNAPGTISAGQTITIRVQVPAQAILNIGNSTIPFNATSAVAPGAPTLNSVTPGKGSAVLNFSAPTNNGGSAISYYTGFCGANGQSTRTTIGQGSPISITGLTGNVTYQCTLNATNNAKLTGNASPYMPVTPLPGEQGNITPILHLLLRDQN